MRDPLTGAYEFEMRILILIAVASIAWSCGLTEVVCTADFRYGLNVTVADSATGAPPAEATLIATSGAFVDTVGPNRPVPAVFNGPPVLILSTAGERPGAYFVLVRSPGYRDWAKGNVEVTADKCHVRPITITARLQPS